MGTHLLQLSTFKDNLYHIARLGTMLFSLLRSLSLIQKEYHFTLSTFLKLFDQAIGGEFPKEFTDSMEADKVTLSGIFLLIVLLASTEYFVELLSMCTIIGYVKWCKQCSN